jgi:hypothetical protein
MDFEEIRAELLSQHADLRFRIDQTLRAADAVSRGSWSHDELKALVDDLSGSLRRHNAWEEETLGDVLPTIDAWGSVRQEIMTEQHVLEHRHLAEALDGFDFPLERTERDALIVTLGRVLEHMDYEEKVINDPRLRNAGIDAEQMSG